MPTGAQKHPSVTLRASHKQPSAPPLSYHRQGPLSGTQANNPAARPARHYKTHKAPQNLKQNATKVSDRPPQKLVVKRHKS